jgi:hypothetical protein
MVGDGDGPRERDEESVCVFVDWRFEAGNECIRREGSRELSEVPGFVRSEVEDRRKQNQKPESELRSSIRTQNRKSESVIRIRNHNQRSQSPSRLSVGGVLPSLFTA